jgi:hypothetical protein
MMLANYYPKQFSDFFDEKATTLKIGTESARSTQNRDVTNYTGILHTRGRNPQQKRTNSSGVSLPNRNETLASVLIRKGSVKDGMAAIQRLILAGGKPNIRTFNQLMTICVNQAKIGNSVPEDAFKIVDLSRTCGVEPDTILFNGVMSCCAKAAAVGKATLQDGSEVLKAMKTAGLCPDIITFNTLLDICAKAARSRPSEDEVQITPMTGYSVLKLLEDEGLSPNLVTFTSLMQVAIL